jgi:Fe-S-cluster containining protein
MEDINKIADEARNSLSKYCMEECHAYCCRKGYIIINHEQVDLVIENKKEKLISEGTLKELLGGKFSFNFTNSFEGCTQLENGKCKIHKNEKRPNVCKEFPIFITGKTIRLSPRCYGIKEGLLYPFIKKFKELGYEIENQ